MIMSILIPLEFLNVIPDFRLLLIKCPQQGATSFFDRLTPSLPRIKKIYSMQLM